MRKVVIYDNFCQLLNEVDDNILKKLDDELSFKLKGIEHSKAFKGYINERGEEITWDGVTRLLKPNLRFPIGLLDRVCKFYTRIKETYEIDDQRRNVTDSCEIDISENLAALNIFPREYQIDAANKAANVNRGIIRAATGAGKSLIAALITAKLGKPTIIYVIGQDLLYQFHKFFSAVFDEEIGIVGDGNCSIKRINICTIWSVGKAFNFDTSLFEEDDGKEKEISKEKFRDIKMMLKTSSVHLLDECHLAACETVQDIAHNVKAEHFYGMSASPWRDDGADMIIESILGNKVVDIPAKLLIQQGFLVNPIIRFIPVPPYKGSNSSKYQTVYKAYITDNAERNEIIKNAAKQLVKQNFKVLILFKNKKHGKNLYKILSSEINCKLLSGDDDSEVRKLVCDEMKEGKIDCIIASTIFDIGVDLPILSALISAGGGKSSVRALQRVGRVIRGYKDKKIAAVIEFADQAPYLFDHSKTRKEILEREFENISWPETKKKQ